MLNEARSARLSPSDDRGGDRQVTSRARIRRRQPHRPLPPATRTHGKRLYEKKTCFFCHGTAGQGSLDGARLAVVARNLQSFTRYVRQPAGRMPAFTDKILTDQELADIFAYVRSLPQAKAVKDIPLLTLMK